MPRSKPSIRPTPAVRAAKANAAASQRLTQQAAAYKAPTQAASARLKAQAAPIVSRRATTARMTAQAKVMPKGPQPRKPKVK